MSLPNFKRFIIRRTLWRLACEFDGVPTDSLLVVFSKKNPWAIKLDAFNRYRRNFDVFKA